METAAAPPTTAVRTAPVAGLAASVAGGLAFALTRRGLLFNPDSPTYLWTSRLIRSNPARLVSLPGDTSLSVRGNFPPLYPAVLAVVGSLGDDLVAARVLGVVLAAAVAGMLVRLVALHSSRTIALT